MESKEQIQPLLTTLEEFTQSPDFKRAANELLELADKTKKLKKESVGRKGDEVRDNVLVLRKKIIQYLHILEFLFHCRAGDTILLLVLNRPNHQNVFGFLVFYFLVVFFPRSIVCFLKKMKAAFSFSIYEGVRVFCILYFDNARN